MDNPKFKCLRVMKQKNNHQNFMRLIKLIYKFLNDNLNYKDLLH